MIIKSVSGLVCVIFCLLFLSGIFLSSAWAQEPEADGQGDLIDQQKIDKLKGDLKEFFPEVKLTPDEPFYFLKSWGEELRIKLTRSLQKRIELRLGYAKERLAEAYSVLEKQKYHVVEKVLQKFETEIEKIKTEVYLTESNDQDVNFVSAKVIENVLYKQAILKEAEERSGVLGVDVQIQAKVMKERGLAKARKTLVEFMTLKVSSEDKKIKKEAKSLKTRILDFIKPRNSEFVSPVVDE